MTYSINASGSGADPDDVKELFENLVRALRAVQFDSTSPIGGSLVASDDTQTITLAASEVADATDPADADPADDQPVTDPTG